MAEAAAPERQLKRALSAFDLTCIGIGRDYWDRNLRAGGNRSGRGTSTRKFLFPRGIKVVRGRGFEPLTPTVSR